MTAKSSEEDYQTLNRELETVLEQLRQPDVQVDEAVKLYEQGLVLAAKLEKHLKTAENKIQKLKLQAGESAS